MKIGIAGLLLLGLFACSTTATRIPANAVDPHPPEVITEASALTNPDLLDFGLSSGEAWKGGSKQTEVAGFVENVQAVLDASRKLSADYPSKGRSGRVFHEKQHGCLTATLKIRGNRPEDPQRQTFVGLFKEPAEYPVIARFSNGIGASGSDVLPDVRGLALKIFYDNNKSVDFLMTNNTNPLARDMDQFVEFMKAQVKGNSAIPGFLKKQVESQKNRNELPYFSHFFRTVSGSIERLTDERYWSGHPYLFGPSTHMKFNVRPDRWSVEKFKRQGEHVGWAEVVEALQTKTVDFIHDSPNYLSERLAYSASKEKVHMIFSVQLEKNQRSTPIENALVEWKEADAPSIPVADLIFDQQNFFNNGRQQECSKLAFTPRHYHPDHRPAGNMGRGRIYAYLASQKLRAAGREGSQTMGRYDADSHPIEEPGVEIVNRWRADGRVTEK